MTSKTSSKSSCENIFKLISSPVTQPSYFLNRVIRESNCFYIEENGDVSFLSKNFDKQSKTLFDWELYVYMKLYEHRIVPPLYKIDEDDYQNKMIYDLRNTISLRMFIKNNTIDTVFINELISFVVNLKNSYYFIHGCLSVDTLFLKLDSNNIDFFVLEFMESMIKDKPFKSSVNSFTDLHSLYTSIYKAFPDEPFIYYLIEEMSLFIDIQYDEIINSYLYHYQ
jgi:hypothetical protein